MINKPISLAMTCGAVLLAMWGLFTFGLVADERDITSIEASGVGWNETGSLSAQSRLFVRGTIQPASSPLALANPENVSTPAGQTNDSTTTTSAPATPTTTTPTTTQRTTRSSTVPPTWPTTAPTWPPPTTSPPTWNPNIIFRDDFNSLNTSLWKPEHSNYGVGNNELQCYRPDNVSVQNGRLVLQARTERYTCPNGSSHQVTSGMVRSQGFGVSPGQAIEFRVKLTPADSNDQGGLWPAVWSSSWAGGGWPRGGELDFLEVMTAEDPRRAMFSMHYANSFGKA